MDRFPLIEPELLAIFSEESCQYLDIMGRLWEKNSLQDGGVIVTKELLRSLHTLKGNARTVNVPDIACLCELLERYVRSRRDENKVIPAQAIPLFKEACEVIRQILAALQDPQIAMPDTQRLQVKVKSFSEDHSVNQNTDNTAAAKGHKPSLSLHDSEPLVEHGTKQQNSSQGQPDTPEEQDRELVEVYLEEATELLDSIDNSLQIWSQNPDDKIITKELQRQLHTLKGGARMSGFANIGNLSHALESLIASVVEGRIDGSRWIFDVLHQSLDRLNLMQENAQSGQPVFPASELIKSIENARKGQTFKPGPVPHSGTLQQGSELRFSSSDDALQCDGITKLKDIESSDSITIENEKIDEGAVLDKSSEQENRHHSQPHRQATVKNENHGGYPIQEMVRVHSGLLDRLVNYAGEVNIYHARLGQQITVFGFNLKELEQTVIRLRSQLRKLEIETEAQVLFHFEQDKDYGDNEFDPLELDRYSTMQHLSRGLGESVGDLVSIQEILTDLIRVAETLLLQQSRVSTDLQEGLMRTRMIQFSSKLPRLRRIARQTASELGKRVDLVFSGEGNELDRSVLDRMIAPLEHLLRNAISHGIEMPDERKNSAKPQTGKVYLEISRDASEIVIKVSDDGAGIDLEAVRDKAKRQGLISSEDTLSDHDVMQFILESGFSTAKQITQISGRGVGLDVVNSEIKGLGGILSIESSYGKGTSFIIRLPFTLAINQALLVQAGEDLYAVPLASIEGVVRLSADELKEKYAQSDPVYKYAGIRYELRHLGALLGMTQPALGASLGIFPLLLVRSGDHRVALQVEGLLGSREIVVKPVGSQVGKVRGISGATILGDGQVVLILDVPGLIRMGAAVQLVGSAKEEKVHSRANRMAEVLVVDDSITIRKVTSRMLERNNYHVVTAKDGVDAIGKLQEYTPDVVLLDIEMPRMDGFELATHIRSNERLKKIPIIMITSRTGEKHRQRAMRIGVNNYLGKPYNESDLLGNIKQMLDLNANQTPLTNIS
ncbi:MAG: response regulator [Pseudomonadota bacterium]